MPFQWSEPAVARFEHPGSCRSLVGRHCLGSYEHAESEQGGEKVEYKINLALAQEGAVAYIEHQAYRWLVGGYRINYWSKSVH
jgi:hypothetical protein